MSKFAELLQSAVCRTRVPGSNRPYPSVFYYPGLSSHHLHNKDFFPVWKNLRDNHDTIINEYQNLRARKQNDYALSKDEHRLHGGRWDWNSYILKGKRQTDFAVHCPKTTEVLESFSTPGLMLHTPFSFAFFSTLGGNSSISPHYGPCNLRVRCHYPLLVPKGDCGMRIGSETIKWEEGNPVFFDDCYEHQGKFL